MSTALRKISAIKKGSPLQVKLIHEHFPESGSHLWFPAISEKKTGGDFIFFGPIQSFFWSHDVERCAENICIQSAFVPDGYGAKRWNGVSRSWIHNMTNGTSIDVAVVFRSSAG